VANSLFYVMALGAVLAALGVVGLRTPMASVLSLLGGFFCLATIYLLAGFPLLAAVQVLVYAGAILVLFLFVIMLLNLEDAAHVTPLGAEVLRARQVGLVAAVAGALLAVGLGAQLLQGPLAVDPALAGARLDDTGALAGAIFGRHLVAFEAISLLLLATAVAVLVLAKRERRASQPRGAEPSAGAAEPPLPSEAGRLPGPGARRAQGSELAPTAGGRS
jgi:NADH-quinone oxidoreductase subunit J